jgi:NAD(P) transhydrogenase subunit alpha
MDIAALKDHAQRVVQAAKDLGQEARTLDTMVNSLVDKPGASEGMDPFVVCLTVFVLACFVGYYVVWKVTPALHSPLMAVTNAISSVIIVGALIAAGSAAGGVSATFGFLAVVLASVNIFGGFVITQRMLAMFSKNK